MFLKTMQTREDGKMKKKKKKKRERRKRERERERSSRRCQCQQQQLIGRQIIEQSAVDLQISKERKLRCIDK